MKTEDIFNANSYTSKAMPVTYELAESLKEEFTGVSDEVKEFREQHQDVSERYDSFYKSLTKDQQEIIFDNDWDRMIEWDMQATENFAKGLKLGFRLAMELLD